MDCAALRLLGRLLGSDGPAMTAQSADKHAQPATAALVFFDAWSDGDSEDKAAEGRSRLCVRLSAIALGRKWRDDQLLQARVENQFKAADVAAIHALLFGAVAVVSDLRFAGRTLPRHGDADPNYGPRQAWIGARRRWKNCAGLGRSRSSLVVALVTFSPDQ
jgi:hypothetical protein